VKTVYSMIGGQEVHSLDTACGAPALVILADQRHGFFINCLVFWKIPDVLTTCKICPHLGANLLQVYSFCWNEEDEIRSNWKNICAAIFWQILLSAVSQCV